MRRLFTYMLLAIPFLVSAQFDQISVGPSYSLSNWYDLESGADVAEPYNSWDIAFSTQGLQDGGIFVNEALPLDMSGSLTEVELYLTTASDLTEVTAFDTSQWTRLYNQEVSWEWGAFNEAADPMNPLDYGWGKYNPATMTIEGDKIYVLKLRNGEIKKMKVNSLTLNYDFVYSDLDGSNEENVSVVKNNNEGSLAYYSLENDVLLDLEPANWDLYFGRYTTLADNGAGVFIENYMVTGVLAGPGVKIAQADGIDPTTVDSTLYTDQYSSDLDVIGHDWKFFDLGAFQWVMDTNLAYFVKTADAAVCKVEFIDFEGSSTGITTINRDCSNVLSSNEDLLNENTSINVFPNPSDGNIDLVVELEDNQDGLLEVYSMTGEKVFSKPMSFKSGFTSQSLFLPITRGMYQMVIRLEGELITRPIVVTK